MGVHLYTNGAWTDSGRIYRNSLNLIENYIDRASIETDGTISSTENYRMFYGKVEQGKTYTIDENTTLCGFFENEPTIGSQTYNEQRIYQTSPTFTAPINGYFCYRKLYSSSTAMMNEGSYLMPYEPYNVVDWYTNSGHGYSSGAWS